MEDLMPEVKVSEPDIYGPDSTNSFFRDVFASATRTNGAVEAEKRLGKYGEFLAGSSAGKAGVEARKVWASAFRGELRNGEAPEVRAMTTGPSSAGALITPLYLTDQFQAWNEFAPSFALACTPVDLPAYGMQVNIPAVTASTPAPAQASENTAVENDATGTYRTANLTTFFGTTDISQQLLDRTGPTGLDKVLYAQLQQSMWTSIDATTVAAVVAAIPGANQLTRATLAAAPFNTLAGTTLADVGHASYLLYSSGGVKIPATHVFMTPSRNYITALQVDNQSRPIFIDNAIDPDPRTGFSGFHLGLASAYVNGTIQPSGANDVILVANPKATALAKGDPYLSANVETKAGQLSVTLRLYCYAAPVVRLPGAAASITGAAYPTAVTWP